MVLTVTDTKLGQHHGGLRVIGIERLGWLEAIGSKVLTILVDVSPASVAPQHLHSTPRDRATNTSYCAADTGVAAAA